MILKDEASDKTFKYFSELKKMLPAVNYWIAGGSVLDVYAHYKENKIHRPLVRDYDLFFETQQGIICFEENLQQNSFISAQKIRDSEFSTSYSTLIGQIDIIKYRLFPSLESVFCSFDFSVCKIGVVDQGIFCDCDFSRSITTKTYYINTDIPSDRANKTLARVAKYMRKGYFPNHLNFESFIKKHFCSCENYNLYMQGE